MKRNGSLSISAVLLVSLIAILVLVPSARSQTIKTLYTFTGHTDGGDPTAGVVFDQAGNLYGTTYSGGALSSGTVFKLTPNPDGSWSESVIHTFVRGVTDGANPAAGLVFDQLGNLYGTTYNGGAGGSGTVFELTPNGDGSWRESLLYQFNGYYGANPSSGVIFDQAGNLYGTTEEGDQFGYGGVVFKLFLQAGTWHENVLYEFCSLAKCIDGASPTAGVAFDKAGDLYGTTRDKGAHYHGVVFRLSFIESVLTSFPDIHYGWGPYAGLTFDAAGNLYGTTARGGNISQCNCGVVFQLTRNADGTWKEKVLHTFTGGADGGSPYASVIFDQSGNLYGTTYSGGQLKACKAGCGVVFKLAPKAKGEWNETVLTRFGNHPGAHPQAGVIFDAAGNLYGTTTGDGSTTFGSVFEITP